ncbi:putative HIT-like protein [bacterium AB1]|nr:putative HIT-like protein [bacterium AB1]
MTYNKNNIFYKIINQEIKSKIFFQNENIIVIYDINPINNTHLLIIPKSEIIDLNDLFEKNYLIFIDEIKNFIHLMKNKYNVDSYQLITNIGEFQEVKHLHFHFISNIKI